MFATKIAEELRASELSGSCDGLVLRQRSLLLHLTREKESSTGLITAIAASLPIRSQLGEMAVERISAKLRLEGEITCESYALRVLLSPVAKTRANCRKARAPHHLLREKKSRVR